MENQIEKSPEIVEYIEAGGAIWHELVKLRPENTDLIVCPVHLGDTIWVASLAHEYKIQKKCQHICFVVKNPQKEILSYFPDIDATITLTDDEMLSLQIYILSEKCWNQDHIVYAHTHHVILTSNSIQYIISKKTMLEEQKSILGLNGDVLISKMFPLDDGNNEKLKELLGKAVLLMPVAQTLDLIPISFWEKLAAKYKELGYTVYTNYNGFDYEILINDTIPLPSSITKLATIAPYFAQVISLRSGVCELLAMTDTNLVILYNKLVDEVKIILQKNDLDYYNIYDLVDKETIFNYQYIESLEDDLIQICLEQI